MIDRSIRNAEAVKLREAFELKKSLEKQKGVELTQTAIAKQIGWTQPNVAAYLKGNVVLKEDSALKFAEALDVPVEFFSPRIADRISQRELLARNPLNRTKVTYVPKVGAAILNKVRQNLKDKSFIMPMSEETTPVPKELPSNAFAFELKDQSLSDKVPEGTVFIFNPLLDPKPTNWVLVGNKSRDDDFHIREYCVLSVSDKGEENYVLKSHNPSYPDLRDNYEVLGVAVMMVSMLSV